MKKVLLSNLITEEIKKGYKWGLYYSNNPEAEITIVFDSDNDFVGFEIDVQNNNDEGYENSIEYKIMNDGIENLEIGKWKEYSIKGVY